MQKLSPGRCRNLISTWSLVWDAVSIGCSLRVQHALLSESLTNQVLGRAGVTECLHVPRESPIQASFDYSLVEKLLAALAICWGCYQVSPLAHQMSSAQSRLHPFPFVIERPPEPSIRWSPIFYLTDGSSRPRLPSLVVSIRQTLSASAENAPCDAVLF